MKKLLLTVSIVQIIGSLLLFVFVSFRHEIVTILWQRFHVDAVVVRLEPKNAELSFTIAEYYFNHGGYNVSKAEKYYTRTITLDPQFRDAYYQRGRVFFIQGKFISAITDIRTVLELDPEFKKAYYMYGLISGYMKNSEQAIYGFSEFIKRDDFNWAGYNDLAWIYFKKGDFEKTREVAKKGLERAQTNPWLNNIYGTALLNLGDKAGAKQAFEIAKNESDKLDPESWGEAYPGNNPGIYAQGLAETRSVIEHNLALTNKQDSSE